MSSRINIEVHPEEDASFLSLPARNLMKDFDFFGRFHIERMDPRAESGRNFIIPLADAAKRDLRRVNPGG